MPKSRKNDKPEYGGLTPVMFRPKVKVKFPWKRKRAGLSGRQPAGRPRNAAEVTELLTRRLSEVGKLEGCRQVAPLQASEE